MRNTETARETGKTIRRYSTHKRTAAGRAETLRRKEIRREKYAR